MRTILTYILVFLSSFSFGQFAIIQDKDGYCVVMNSPLPDARATDTLTNGQFVYCFSEKGDWIDISYTKNKVEAKGYVSYNKLQLLSTHDTFAVVKKGATSITLGRDSMRVMVTQQSFDRSRYKLTFHKESKRQIEKINGKDFWGTDGEMPHSEYKAIVVSFGKRKIVLPRAALANLFEPRLSATEANYDRANDIFYIQSANSDGAGYYTVIWRIEKGVYKDRYVVYGF
ncbi:MAG: hypothetical protein V4722_05660 [Bacteroidota bacterium]